MSLWRRHIDAAVVDFAAGDLGPGATQRMLGHARSCPRCASLLNKVLLAQRVLQGSVGKPTEEEASLWAASAAAVAAASATAAPRSSAWSWRLAFAAAAAVVALVFLARPGPAPEFALRGDGVSNKATLRVYCASPAGPLEELAIGQGCGVGRSLAFAVGARAPLKEARLTVRQGGSVLGRQDFEVAGVPGAEEAVALSVAVKQAGRVMVEADFAESGGDLARPKVRVAREVPAR